MTRVIYHDSRSGFLRNLAPEPIKPASGQSDLGTIHPPIANQMPVHDPGR
jgi:hypothetical protein